MIPVREVREVALRPSRYAALAVAAAALAFLASSCRVSPFSPAGDPAISAPLRSGAAAASRVLPAPAPAQGPGGDQDLRAPVITQLHGEVRNGTLYLTGQLVMPGPRVNIPYSPSQPGDWCLQVFLNTDQAGTGYWRGYDYIVRGVEWDPHFGTTVVRQITLEPDTPGGWGPASGRAELLADRRSLSIAVPLRAIGGDDGNLDFALETYATVACPECAGGSTQEYVADYFGTCASTAAPGPASGPFALAERAQRPAWGARVSASDAGR